MSSGSAAAPVYGLILAGGSSSRMKRDKAALPYRGRSQLDRAFDLAARHVQHVFVSIRAGQEDEPSRANKPLIVDLGFGAGPIAGIRSAFAAHADVAWLVLACDLPFLSDLTLEHLLATRDPGVLATAYHSSHDGLPEPLCAIWEPAAAAALSAYAAQGGHCPRKFLLRHATRLLDPVEPKALDNVNTPEEYAEALGDLEPATAVDSATVVEPPTAVDPAAGGHLKRIHVQYYALLREQAGRSEEMLETSAATPTALYFELNARYRFTLTPEYLKVAVNSEFADWSRPLAPGDAVVFIPPVAGG